MNSLKPAVVGFALAVVVCFIMSKLEPRHGLDVLASILVAAAAVYVGSALSDERDGSRVLETVLFLAFFVVAMIGLWYSPALLAGGYVAHGVWDFFHHPHRIGARAGTFYPPFCLVADGVIAAFVLVRF